MTPASRAPGLLRRSRFGARRSGGCCSSAAPASARSSAPQPAVGGFHPLEWGAEFIGTTFQLGLGFIAVAVLSVRASPVYIQPLTPRLLAIGAVFGVLAAAVATSPLGKRSGAHLNPAVTLGFFLRGHVHRHDVLGYMVAQVLGALGAAAIFTVALRGWAGDVHDAVTQFVPARRTLTAKLFHDERYISTLRTELPAQPS